MPVPAPSVARACRVLAATVVLAGVLTSATIPANAASSSSGIPSNSGRADPAVSSDASGPVVGATSSELDVRALGDPDRARMAEQRQFRHSGDQPAGRFVTAGKELVVHVPDGVTGLTLAIGQYGVYRDLNGGTATAPSVEHLQPGTTTITAPQDGLVNLRDTGAAGSRTTHVTVTGGTAVPTFVRGVTDPRAFDSAVAGSGAPFALLIGDRVFAEMQRSSVAQHLRPGRAAEQVAQLDRTVDLTDRAWGLSRGGDGVAGRPDQRVGIASPDTAGGYASAGNDRVYFQVETGAAQEILDGAPADQWGFWHEVGHTYQPKVVTWSGLEETSVNISSLAVQQGLGLPDRLDDDERQPDVDTFFAGAVAERDFDAADGWARLLMFDQLTRAFGPDFYARLGQEDRASAAVGEQADASPDARKQRFAVLAATIADRDLRPFFEQWGIDLSPETGALLATLPALHNRIWESRDSTTAPTERTVTYTTPSAQITASGAATLGQRTVGGQVRAGVSDVVRGTASGAPRVIASATGDRAGRVAQLLVAPDGTTNAVTAPLDVVHGTDVEALGISDDRLAVLALDVASGTLSVDGPATHDPHPYFDREYLGATYRRADGTVLADASITGVGESEGLAADFDGIRYRDGDVLVLRHAEAGTRLQRWDGGHRVAQETATTQAFRVDGNRLVAIPEGEVPVPRTSADRIELLGLGNQIDARITLHDGHFTATMPFDGWTHDYYAGRTYLAARVLTVDGTELRSATIAGDSNAQALVTALDGTQAPDGTILVIDHAEAGTRLRTYDGDRRLDGAPATTQAFRVNGNRLVAIGLEALPGQ